MAAGSDMRTSMFESSYGEGVAAETWEFRLSQEPATLWSVLADTNRLFEALEYPRYALSDENDASSGVRRRVARSGTGGRAVEWEERPFEWATGQWWRMQRVYKKGPLARLDATLYLRRSAGGGSIAQYTLNAEPNGMRGRTLVSSGQLRRMGDLFVKRAEEADDYLAGRSERPFQLKPPPLSRSALAEIDARADAAAETAEAQADPIFDAIVHMLKTGSEADVALIRPRILARRLDRPPQAAMAACLAAAEVGLLRRRFLPICPECRRPAVGADRLAGLAGSAYCQFDKIWFGIDLAQNVELSFMASPDLRDVGSGGYCLSGPLTSPHIVLQQELDPGERRALPFQPPVGGYRFRVETVAGETPAGRGPWRAPLDISTGPTPTLLAMDDGVAVGGAPADQALVLENHASRRMRFIVEVRAWRGDAASAASAVLTEAHRRAFPLDAPPAPLPAGRAYAVSFTVLTELATRQALGSSEAARRFSAMMRSASELAQNDGGVLLRRGSEAGVALFGAVHAAAAFATALRETARVVLAGRDGRGLRQVDEPPSFDANQAPPALGLGVAIDEGDIVLLDTGAGCDAAGGGIARAEALAHLAGRDGLLVCREAAAAPEAEGLWPEHREDVEAALDENGGVVRVVRFA
ncbi:MAG: hypothetical protein MRY74_15570 [Neomegalonema sp.]|nr:hypothetical protein [Neomegalonema sp.]